MNFVILHENPTTEKKMPEFFWFNATSPHRCSVPTSHPRMIRAILLECTELPPYADALRYHTGLPVWDAITAQHPRGAPMAQCGAGLELHQPTVNESW